MPRYYFHVREDSTLHRDEERQDLPDAATARHKAVSAGREILGEKLLHGGSLDNRTIEIADEAGTVVGAVNILEILFHDGRFRTYSDDVTQSAPTNPPRK